uniref:TIL domain-containing protein n=1 Tax=Octopus bimaculoides TaxID=37653 RepID=A0A0L8GPL3_OCTBM
MVSLTLKLMLISLALCVGVEAVFFSGGCSTRCMVALCKLSTSVACSKKCACYCRTRAEAMLNKENCPPVNSRGSASNSKSISESDSTTESPQEEPSYLY